MMVAMVRLRRSAILWAGLSAWLLVSIPTLSQATGSPRFPAWLIAWLVFGLAFAFSWGRKRLDFLAGAGLVLQASAVVLMVGLLCNGFEGMLLVLVAAQFGGLLGTGTGIGWILVQTAALVTGITVHWSLRPALMLAPPYLGFQVFVFLVFRLQARLNERSRLLERLRIAQELHDALGHHLTTLALNLEVAAQLTVGQAQESIRTAQLMSRLLLDDVRELVRAVKADETIDLVAELRRLARDVPSPRVHVAVAGEVRIGDGRWSHTFLRCAQEFVTNSVRHGRADNVWFELKEADGGVELLARDDGRGVAEIRNGDGLLGMRRRFEELGGTLVIESQEHAGFALTARLLPGPNAR
jgi:signal transduction histidine kinase